jgi:protein-L-isoaspartate(D-aspartate) O-methyltransferase
LPPALAGRAPFDVIVLTGAVRVLPSQLLAALVPGGRAFAVVGELPVMTAQLVHCVAAGTYRTVELFETVLAPLQNCEQPSKFHF